MVLFRKSPSAKFFRLALFSLVFAFAGVLLGAYARFSDAGLGCPDWPGCYGKLFAPITPGDISDAHALYPERPVDSYKAWKEMMHRYVSGVLGLLVFRLGWLGWRLRRNGGRMRSLMTTLILSLVMFQALLGMLGVTLQLKPLIVMGHLIVGMTILMLLWWVLLREHRFWRPPPDSPAARRLRLRALFALGLVAGQIALGGWTSANAASLVCPDFPTCQGSWWPEADFIDAFTLWRGIGIDYDGSALSVPAAIAVHLAHRVGALIVTLYVGWLALRTISTGGDTQLCRYGLLVLVLLLTQVALGIAGIVTHLPLALSVAHNGVAALLLLSLVTLNHVVRPRAVGGRST